MLADHNGNSSSPSMPVWHKVMREVARPFGRHRKNNRNAAALQQRPASEPKPARLDTFDPQTCTVEPDGLELLKELVRDSARYDGPIIEIGTLLGITATHMALVKQPRQKIITVDNYCWNPWALPADAHHALAQQILLYLTSCGEVQQLRMDKAEFYESYRGPAPALVFLDAWHTYEETKKDIEWAIRCGARIIAGHDYCPEFEGVKQVVHEFGGPRKLAGTVWALHSQVS